jgi:hypothetical protein
MKRTNFDLKFHPYRGVMILEISWKFRRKRMFFSRDIEVPKNSRSLQTCHKNRIYFELQYLEKGISFFAETFRTFTESLDLYMGKISDRNSFIWLFWWPTAIGRKSSKTEITFERNNRNLNPFRVFTRTLYRVSIGNKFIENGVGHLRQFLL